MNTVERPKHIAAEWAQYVERILPLTASPVQKQETRRAFYAGAYSMLTRLVRVVSDGDDVTPEDEAIFDDVRTEFEAFLEAMKAGTA